MRPEESDMEEEDHSDDEPEHPVLVHLPLPQGRVEADPGHWQVEADGGARPANDQANPVADAGTPGQGDNEMQDGSASHQDDQPTQTITMAGADPALVQVPYEGPHTRRNDCRHSHLWEVSTTDCLEQPRVQK